MYVDMSHTVKCNIICNGGDTCLGSAHNEIEKQMKILKISMIGVLIIR